MIALASALENRELAFDEAHEALQQGQFVLGGNWDYSHGSFDKSLDNENLVWLRIPFDVFNGRLDAEADRTGAIIRLGKPYVLKHVYNDGLDPGARIGVASALVDQFQEPVDPDAELEPHWVEAAKQALEQAEQLVRD